MSGMQIVDSDNNSDNNSDDERLFVVMENIAGHWTPFVALRNKDDAEKLSEILSANGTSTITPSLLCNTEQDEKNGDKLSVGYKGNHVYAVSTDDTVIQKEQAKHGGYRDMVTVYDSIEQVVLDKPDAIKSYIISQMDEEILSYI